MSEFERVLQQCLQDLERGVTNVEECLHRHPRHAAQLAPILLTSLYLARGREAQLSNAFKARVRTRLVRQMYAHPRRPARPSFMFMRLVSGLAAIMLALLVAGTAFAQHALPGESFYSWKITSEHAWRLVSPDPLGTDLVILERRFEELMAVRNDPVLQIQVLAAYLQVVDRLKAQVDAENEERIRVILDAQAEDLNQLGVLPKELVPNVIPPLEAPTATPAITALPVWETPQVNPTELPPILPTVEIVPEVLPTVPDPPKPIPKIEIPSVIP